MCEGAEIVGMGSKWKEEEDKNGARCVHEDLHEHLHHTELD
jgi:hypothetical protein